MNNFYNNIPFVDYIPVIHERNARLGGINPFLAYPQTGTKRESDIDDSPAQEQPVSTSPTVEQQTEQNPVTEKNESTQPIKIEGQFEQPARKTAVEVVVPDELKAYHQISDGVKFTDDGLKLLYAAQYYGIPLRVTSSYRTNWNPTSKSWHKTGQALDITPQYSSTDLGVRKKEWEEFKHKILRNKSFLHWLTNEGYGILDETDPEIKKRTKATGDHWHIGPDRWAQAWLKTAMDARKNDLATEYHPYYDYENRNKYAVSSKDDPSGNNDRFYNTVIPIYKKILEDNGLPTTYMKGLLTDISEKRGEDGYTFGYDGIYEFNNKYYDSLYDLLLDHVNSRITPSYSTVLDGAKMMQNYVKYNKELEDYMKRNNISAWRRGGMINKYLK